MVEVSDQPVPDVFRECSCCDHSARTRKADLRTIPWSLAYQANSGSFIGRSYLGSRDRLDPRPDNKATEQGELLEGLHISDGALYSGGFDPLLVSH